MLITNRLKEIVRHNRALENEERFRIGSLNTYSASKESNPLSSIRISVSLLRRYFPVTLLLSGNLKIAVSYCS